MYTQTHTLTDTTSAKGSKEFISQCIDKKKKQNEGLQSPAEKKPEEKDISPEINKIAASSSSQSGGKRALFAK